jgi:hypothetical protein
MNFVFGFFIFIQIGVPLKSTDSQPRYRIYFVRECPFRPEQKKKGGHGWVRKVQLKWENKKHMYLKQF